jgi:cytochrome c oxidase subunit 2
MHKSRAFVTVVVVWLVVSAIGMVLVATVLAPHLPPGTASTEASGQQFDNEVLTIVSVPIVAMVIVYLGYVLIAFREREPAKVQDGPPIRGNMRLQTTWVVVTGLTVLFLAAFGTYELLDGAGGGQGANPVFVPSTQETSAAAVATSSNSPLQVQVIAQQWQFTYRYPDNGGFETAHLVLPVGQQVELHVTSLDVIHSFWALELGVKADANPGVDNIAYVTPKHTGSFDIHCAELCGLFHGYMFDTGQVMTAAGFSAWVKQQRVFMSPVARYLPPYSTTYLPDPQLRGG